MGVRGQRPSHRVESDDEAVRVITLLDEREERSVD